MGLFNFGKKQNNTNYQYVGIKPSEEFIKQFDRFSDLHTYFQSSQKVYSIEEIGIMSSKLSEAGNPIDIWASFVWIPEKENISWKTTIQVTCPKEPNYDAIEKFNFQGRPTKEDLDLAYEEYKRIGFVFGTQFHTISEESSYKFVFKSFMEKYGVHLMNHFFNHSIYAHFYQNETHGNIFYVLTPKKEKV